MEIDEIAGHVEGGDLPLALLQHVVAGGKPLKKETALGRLVMAIDNVLSRADDGPPDRRLLQGLPLGFRKLVSRRELPD